MGLTFQGNRFIITVHHHLVESDILEFQNIFRSRNLDLKCKAFNEIGVTGHKHAHIVVLLSKRTKLSSAKKWQKARVLFGAFNIKRISTDEHFLNSLAYCNSAKKSEGDSIVIYDSIGLWEPEEDYHTQVMNFILLAKSWSSVISSSTHGAYISTRMTWARALYNNRPALPFTAFTKESARKWQKYFINALAPQCKDDRKIHVVVDPKGGGGKSKLADYLQYHHNAFITEGGSKKDIACSYDGQPIVVFDIARNGECELNYSALESFKNGRIQSNKYESHLKRFETPHVIVLANWDLDYSKISQDQWDIYHLQDLQLIPQKLVQGVPVNVKEPPEKVRNPWHASLPEIPIACHGENSEREDIEVNHASIVSRNSLSPRSRKSPEKSRNKKITSTSIGSPIVTCSPTPLGAQHQLPLQEKTRSLCANPTPSMRRYLAT